MSRLTQETRGLAFFRVKDHPLTIGQFWELLVNSLLLLQMTIMFTRINFLVRQKQLVAENALVTSSTEHNFLEYSTFGLFGAAWPNTDHCAINPQTNHPLGFSEWG
ncbi:hypothetical protein AVEN_254334-1 [Araneus ventricosus]|uniref:Uncharacterized protein n=1 Tax=Araneus ventricosus TaxID=182803 RepID=A0A4Y2M9T5_ARAVE|nr:hypothetical protein AVEN_254334-1 [Araneus ventricosus]